MKLYRDFTQQEEIDREYDCESALDMPSYIDWFVTNSARARTELECRPT